MNNIFFFKCHYRR